jgi:CRP/FNR family transcriptional regulator
MEVMPERPERPSVISVLRSSTLLNALTADDLEELATLSHLAYAERGETIWMKGNQVDFFGLVGNGFVKMVRSFATGQEVTSEIIGPGQIFGLLGVIEGGGCPLEARSVSNAWYLKIPKREILHIHEQRLVFKDQLLRRTVTRFRQSVDMMAKMTTGKVEQRIALIRLMLAESYGEQTAEGVRLKVPLIRQDIAEMAGTTVESTIRTMSRWQKKNWLSSDHKHITITKMELLEEFLLP